MIPFSNLKNKVIGIGMLASLCVMTSCMLLPNGGAAIGIANLDTGEKKYIEAGHWLELIESIDDTTRTFRSITRTGIKGNGITISTWSYEGKHLDTKELPLLTSSIGSNNNHAISPDGNSFLYFNYDTSTNYHNGSLCLYDIKNKSNTCLIPNISSCGLSIRMLKFLSDNEILIVLNKDEDVGRRDCQICIFSLSTKKLEVIYRPLSIDYFTYALSRSKKYLAFYEGFTPNANRNGYVKILDLKNKKIVASISGARDKMIGNLDWSDERYVCYTHGHEALVYDMETNISQSIIKFKDNSICYTLKFQNKDTLCYRVGDAPSKACHNPPQKPLTFIDIRTGKVIKEVSFDHEFNGPLYIADDGKLLIANIGF